MVLTARVRVSAALAGAAFALLLCAAGVDRVAAQARAHPVDVDAPAPSDPVFDDSVVHEIRLAINSKDWQSLKDHYLENTYYPADWRWRDQVVRNLGIRSRGTGSRSGVKPGLRVDFDRYSTDQTFLGLKSIILRNNTQDASNLHERVSMLLFRRLQLPAPREAHTTLYVNNEYVGLFTIVESVDKAFLRRTFGDDDGYLYDYDYPADAAPYYFDYRGDDPGLYVPVPFKPETHELDPRPEVIVDWIRTINESADAVFRTAIAEYLDLGRVVRHVAVEVFLADTDGFIGNWGPNNFYLYRPAASHLFTLIAWDKSEAFTGGFDYGVLHNLTDVPADQRNRLVARALAQPDLYDLYLDTLIECARTADQPPDDDPEGTGWLAREIQRQYLQVRDAAWADPMAPFSGEDFERGVADMSTFARDRGAVVRRQVDAARPSRRR